MLRTLSEAGADTRQEAVQLYERYLGDAYLVQEEDEAEKKRRRRKKAVGEGKDVAPSQNLKLQ